MLSCWKVFRSGVINCVDRVYYPARMTAQEVHALLEDDYDFSFTIALDEAD
jgi:hypothetical protein